MTGPQDHWAPEGDTALCIQPLLYVSLVLGSLSQSVQHCQ